MKKFEYGHNGNKIYKTLGFKDQEGVLEEVKHLWDEKTHCKPKVITIQEAIDNGWMTKSHWKNQCIISEDILTYKVWYLYTDIRRNGVWSPPNGVLREQDTQNWIHFHPGPNRVKALCMLGLYDTNLVIWDPMNRIDKPELSFDEWLSYFPEEKARVWFSRCEKFIGDKDTVFMLEAHLEQTMDPFRNMEELVKELFRNTKPKMINYRSPELDAFVHYEGNDHGVEIFVKEGQVFTLDDFDLCININDVDRRYEDEKVIITVR